jgi:protocatechuate 3,4-dioxygenase beta subunit
MSRRTHLAEDLRTLSRRRMLQFLGGAAIVPLIGCTSDDNAGPDAATSSGGSCSKIPTETGGPYPGDGTNGVNALAMSGIVRSDIRSSFGTSSGVADGVVLAVTLAVVDVGSACSPLSGRAVYIWHCTRDGNYSLYSSPVTGENFLRGVQETDADGRVTFTTIVPGCYAGRWPHIHVEVFASLAAATTGRNAIQTTQIAIPQATCDEVYATSAYASSARNLAQLSMSSDLVFSDGATLETPTMSGSLDTGYALALQIGI